MRTNWLLAASFTILAPSAPRAQEPPKAPPPEVDLVELGDVLGAEVLFATEKPPGEERAAPAGKLSDFVLDAKQRTIVFAAVTAADKTRAVPIARLRFDGKAKLWQLTCSKTEFERLDELPPRDLVASDTAPNCYATKLAAACVTFGDGKALGNATAFVLERRTGAAAFLEVQSSNGIVAVPMAAVAILKGGVDRQPSVLLDLGEDDFADVPRLGSDRMKSLADAPFRGRLYEVFGVARPAFEPRSDVRRGKGDG